MTILEDCALKAVIRTAEHISNIDESLRELVNILKAATKDSAAQEKLAKMKTECHRLAESINRINNGKAA